MLATIRGIPRLQWVEGLSEAEVASLLSLTAYGATTFSSPLGWLTSRHPLRHDNLALTVTGVNVSGWTAVLPQSGGAPWWLLILLVVVVSVNGPGTGVGFDYSRTPPPPYRLGTANGLVVTGFFTGATLSLLAVSALLGWLNPSGNYITKQLNQTMALRSTFFAVGLVGIFSTYHRPRTMMRPHGMIVLI